MGKKLFKFLKDAAQGPEKPDGESAASVNPSSEFPDPGKRMRALLKTEYTPQQLEALKSLAEGKESAIRYDDRPIAVEEIIAPPTDMLKIISEQTGLRIIKLMDYTKIDHHLRALVTANQAKTLKVLPIEETEDGRIVVAIADPSDPTIADDLRLILGRDVETVIADEDELNERIEQYYGMGDETIEALVDRAHEEDETDDDVIQVDETEVDLSDLEVIANAPPIIKLVNYMLLQAINDRASDIHIEPFPTFIRVRYRVDGVLREIPSPPRSQLVAITSRIKVMASLNISETRLPQGGRIKLSLEEREVDMRVSTIPTVHGESVVMRVLDRGMMSIGISQIGMLAEVLDDFTKMIRKPNGIVLVTGPTGCGKTTTLYAALAEVQDPGEKLITTEDPVEYELDGIQQVNINDAVGLTFARCLRAILRQDPDKVLVGEIRDVETAQIAVQASLTGHLVFSTLHTNSAAATVTRLLDMGVEAFLITSSVLAVIGQRLVRTICQACKKPIEPTAEDLADFGTTPEEIKAEGITFYQGEGCRECSHSGYHGRMGIFELLVITDEIQELILERGTTDEVQDLAMREGMIGMRQDGWVKACMGLTTLSEIARQTPKASGMSTATPAALPSAEEPEEIAEESQQALPKPASQLDAKTMQVKSEEAMPLHEAGDADSPPPE
jgi:type II secretion system protein E